MTTERILLTLFLLGSVSCARAERSIQSDARSEAALAGVLDDWDADTSSYFAGERERLFISDHAVTVRKVCRGWFRRAVVEVSAPARVSGSHIEVLSSASRISEPGQPACAVKIDAGVTAFAIKNDELILTPALGRTYVYGHRHRRSHHAWASSGWTRPSSGPATSPARTQARARAVESIGRYIFSKSQPSGGAAGGTYRATSRPSTYTVSNAHGTGVKRVSGRTRAGRGK